jgi:ABC-2 type transport system ATP-binding protein
MAGAIVTVAGVTRRFGARTALADVSFTVAAGELCGLVGGNGAGKTTLLRVMAGFLDADRRARRRSTGATSPPRRQRAARPARLPGRGRAGAARARRRRVPAARARLRGARPRSRRRRWPRSGSPGAAGDALGTLSKGQRQRVAWVEAGLGAPPVLLLDEPAAGLDEEERAAVRARLAAGRGARTVVWASHELADVEAEADRVVILVGGAVAAVGTLAELRAARRRRRRAAARGGRRGWRARA